MDKKKEKENEYRRRLIYEITKREGRKIEEELYKIEDLEDRLAILSNGNIQSEYSKDLFVYYEGEELIIMEKNKRVKFYIVFKDGVKTYKNYDGVIKASSKQEAMKLCKNDKNCIIEEMKFDSRFKNGCQFLFVHDVGVIKDWIIVLGTVDGWKTFKYFFYVAGPVWDSLENDFYKANPKFPQREDQGFTEKDREKLEKFVQTYEVSWTEIIPEFEINMQELRNVRDKLYKKVLK